MVQMRIMSTRITVTVPDEVDDQLPYGDYDSKSETVVEYVQKGFELDRLEAQRDDLRRQLREANRRQREIGELVEYVEEERALQRQERERKNANVVERAKLWVFGMD